MNKHDTPQQQPKKLSLSRETVRNLSNQDGSTKQKELTTPLCTEYGPRCL